MPDDSPPAEPSPPECPPLKPLSCSLCDRRFSKYKGLAWHRKALHRTIVPHPGGGFPLPGTGVDAVGAEAGTAGGSGDSSAGQPPPPPLPCTPPPTVPPPPAHGRGGGVSADGPPDGGGALAPPPLPPSQPLPTGGGSPDAPANDSQHEFEFEDAAVDEAMANMDAIFNLTRRARKPKSPARKKRRVANGGKQVDSCYEYATVAAEVHQHYEDIKDWDSKEPLLVKRKHCTPGRFNSYRLRLLERFCLECGGGGLSLVEQEKMFDFLDAWDRTKLGMPIDHGHYLGIRDTFNSKNASRTHSETTLMMPSKRRGGSRRSWRRAGRRTRRFSGRRWRWRCSA